MPSPCINLFLAGSARERVDLERNVGKIDWDIDESAYSLYGFTDMDRRLAKLEKS